MAISYVQENGCLHNIRTHLLNNEPLVQAITESDWELGDPHTRQRIYEGGRMRTGRILSHIHGDLGKQSFPPQLEARPPASLPAGRARLWTDPHGPGANSNVFPLVCYRSFFEIGESSRFRFGGENWERVPHNERRKDFQ